MQTNPSPPPPLPTQDAVATRLMNAGLLLHCLIAYQIDTNVATYTLLSLVWPRALGRVPLREGYSPILPTRIMHGLVSARSAFSSMCLLCAVAIVPCGPTLSVSF